MFRQVTRTTRVSAVARSALIRSRPLAPLVARARFSSQQYYYEQPEPSKSVRYLLALTAAATAIWFVKPYKPKPKKVEKEEKKEEDPLARFEPPMETEVLVEEPVIEETFVEDAITEEPAEVIPDVTDSSSPVEHTEDANIADEATILTAQATGKATEPKTDASKDKPKGDIASKEGEKMGNLEEETKRESAYNPDTGEINWDCPCLGGMADGPCGEEFKVAFSCFIYSEAEPKGIDCVEKFQGMQTCFRQYPEYYAEQLKDEEEADAIMSTEESSNANENGEIILDETVTVDEPDTIATSEVITEAVQSSKDQLDDPFEEIELTESE